MEHAKYSPSSSHSWLLCPVSADLSGQVEEEPTEAALEGNFLHSMARNCAQYGIDPFDLVGEFYDYQGKNFEFGYDYAQMINSGLEWLKYQILDELMFEKRLCFYEDEFGTCDIVGYNSTRKEILIADWKFGRLGVSAKENTQLGCYGLGALKIFPEAERFVFAIMQPRVSFAVEIWRQSNLGFLKNLQKDIGKVLGSERAQAGPKQCLYCSGRFICRDYVEYVLGKIKEYVEMSKQDLQKLKDEEVADVIRHTKLLTKFFEKVEEIALARMEQGKELPGLKLVEGKAPAAKWKEDEIKTLEKLKKKTGLSEAELCVTKLLTPAQTLELVGKSSPEKTKIVSDLSLRDNPKRKVVLEEAKGEAVPALIADFDQF